MFHRFLNFAKNVSISFHVIIIFGCLVWIGFGYIIYFKTTSLPEITNFIAAWATSGVFLLTIIYVLFTGRQVLEIQKQRLLQIQPFPLVDFHIATLNTMRLCISYKDNKVLLLVDFDICFSIKNVGNGTATVIDCGATIRGKNIKGRTLKTSISRIMALPENEEKKVICSFRDFENMIFDALQNTQGCPVEKIDNLILSLSIFFQNTSGQAFRANISAYPQIPSEVECELEKWCLIYRTFLESKKTDISKIETMLQRGNNNEAMHKAFSELKEQLNAELTHKTIPIHIFPLTQTLSVKPLSSKRYEEFAKSFNHRFPVKKKITNNYLEYIPDEWKECFKATMNSD